MRKINISVVRESLDYDCDTGCFIWKKRPISHFKDARAQKSWNTRYSGRAAGVLDGFGYFMIGLMDQKVRAHSLAWVLVYNEWPKGQVDHINHDKSDNRIVNLRVVSHKDNAKNAGVRVDNTSGIVGVTWDKRLTKWKAQIYANNKNVYLGSFTDKFKAICARKSAEIKYEFHENHGVVICEQ